MEIAELVSVLEVAVATDEYCDGEKSNPKNWKARIIRWGTEKKCSGSNLYRRMKNAKDKEQGYLGPPTPFVSKPGTVGYPWDLGKCKPDHFPIQAHHIIPKSHLPEHGVCAFLAKDYKDPNYELTADTYYDTDHANNGYCMPYATPLKEWKKAKNDNDKLAITYLVMNATGRQLHQGSHTAGPYDDPSDAEEEAEDEEPGMHAVGGYLDTVDDFLKCVQKGVSTHVDGCTICKPKGKKKVQPLEAVVRHVDQVSGLIKLLIDANRIFVSKPAFKHWSKNPQKVEIPEWLKAETYMA